MGEDTTGRLCGVDNTRVSATELATALNSACGGHVIVVLDSGFSGQYIGKGLSNSALATARFNDAVVSAFREAERLIVSRPGADELNSGELANNKYTVLTACAGDEESLTAQLSDGTRCSLFTYYFLSGVGSNYSGTHSNSSMLADTNSDKKITLSEAYNYTSSNITNFNVQYYGSLSYILLKW